MTQSPDAIGTWRDLKDQLTEDQIGELAWLEAQPAPQPRGAWSEDDRREALLFRCQQFVRNNELNAGFADRTPAGAVEIHHGWYLSEDDGPEGEIYARSFSGTSRVLKQRTHPISDDSLSVEIDGIQSSDNSIERCIRVVGEEMSAAEAREVARSLIEAADEIDGLRNDESKRAIGDCPHCDDYGRRADLTNCSHHKSVRGHD